MATITLKGIPPTLHRALKRQAKANRRSLNQEVLALLEEEIKKDRFLADVARFRDSLGFQTTPEDIDAAKREGRK